MNNPPASAEPLPDFGNPPRRRWNPYFVSLAIYAVLIGIIALFFSQFYIWDGHDTLFAVLRTKILAGLWQSHRAGMSRWLPEALYGYGEPMFQFYSPLGYYVSTGAAVWLGISAGAATQLSFMLSLGLSGLAVWGLAVMLGRREGWPNTPWWALAAAVLYTLCPYHLCDIFVRGNLAEAWSWSTLAGLFFALEWSRRHRAAGALALGAAWALLVLSHNIMALYGTIIVCLYVLMTAASVRWLVTVCFGAAIGAGLSAFFWLPSLGLLPWVHGHRPENMLGTPAILLEHALFLGQWLLLNYGRGGSFITQEVNFPINPGVDVVAGLMLALLALFAPGLNKRQRTRIVAGLALIGAIVFLASHAMPWQMTPPVFRYLQFSWRLILPAVFLALLATLSASPVIDRWVHPRVLIFASLLLNLPPLFLILSPSAPVSAIPSKLPPPPELVDDKTLEAEIRRQTSDFHVETAGALALEYLPVGISRDFAQSEWQAKNPPPADRITLPAGVKVTSYRHSGTNYRYRLDAEKDAYVKVHVFYFPGWGLRVDGKKAPERLFETSDGMIGVSVAQGAHKFELEYGTSRIERVARRISHVVFLGCVLVALGLAAVEIKRRRRAANGAFVPVRPDPGRAVDPFWIAGAMGALLLLCIAGEIGVRHRLIARKAPLAAKFGQAFPQDQYSHLTMNQLLIPGGAPAIPFRIAPNVRGEWLGETFRADEHGFRVEDAAPLGTSALPQYRIAAIGGSAMLGWGLPDNDGMLEKLRQFLTARFGFGVNVIKFNGAIPGSDAPAQAAWLEREILPLNPDLVLIQHDLSERPVPYFLHPLALRDGRGLWLLHPGNWWGDGLIQQALARRATIPFLFAAEDASQWERTAAAYARLARLCRERSVPLAAILTASDSARALNKPCEDRIDRFQTLCRDLSIPLVDAASIATRLAGCPSFDGQAVSLDTAPEAHPSAAMNEIAMRALRNELPAIGGPRFEAFIAAAPTTATFAQAFDRELYVEPDSLYDVENWNGVPVRWTRDRTSMILLATGGHMRLKLWVGTPDASTTHPVTVSMAINRGKPIEHSFDQPGIPGQYEFAIANPPDRPHLIDVQIKVNRLFTEPGGIRELGVGLYPVEFY